MSHSDSNDDFQTTSNAFPRVMRLTEPADYQRVFKKARRSNDPMFTVLACGNQLRRPRLGLAVSMKSTGNAVKRNRIKRLLREYFRQHHNELPAVDLVVIAKAGVVRQNRELIVSSLDRHWRSINQQCVDC
ncbi:MAG: ribonuclease P protein component [Gammaproteobacteria bacterium]|nr:ribonuclease P protein component [Gammaproteobacteria bacterium]